MEQCNVATFSLDKGWISDSESRLIYKNTLVGNDAIKPDIARLGPERLMNGKYRKTPPDALQANDKKLTGQVSKAFIQSCLRRCTRKSH